MHRITNENTLSDSSDISTDASLCIYLLQQLLYSAFESFEAERRRVEEELVRKRLAFPQEGLDGAARSREEGEQPLSAASGATSPLQIFEHVLMHQLQG